MSLTMRHARHSARPRDGRVTGPVLRRVLRFTRRAHLGSLDDLPDERPPERHVEHEHSDRVLAVTEQPHAGVPIGHRADAVARASLHRLDDAADELVVVGAEDIRHPGPLSGSGSKSRPVRIARSRGPSRRSMSMTMCSRPPCVATAPKVRESVSMCASGGAGLRSDAFT